MIKHLFISLIVFIILSFATLTVMALVDSSEHGYNSLLSELVDKYTLFSLGKKLESIYENEDKVLKTYGDFTVKTKEVEYAKISFRVTAEHHNSDKSEISTDEAINLALKRKLMIEDAKLRGLVLKTSELKEMLKSLRGNYGVDENGVVNKTMI